MNTQIPRKQWQMAEVSELVLEKLVSESQKWVILVGDGKSYEHLKSIKKLYGSTFENLLVFPGDWHILKNFQPVIMKAYFHAGLQQIAKQAGYKAETLASLENCSHFKRTHYASMGGNVHSNCSHIWEFFSSVCQSPKVYSCRKSFRRLQVHMICFLL